MRILLVHDYAPLYGGAEVVNAGLVEGLRRRGHDVRRFTSTAGLVGNVDESIRPEYACRGTLSRWRTALQTANPWAPLALRRTIADFKPDVVHVKIFETQLSPLILPVLRDVPSVYHADWYRAACFTGLKQLPNGRACTHRAGVACLSKGCVPAHDWLALMAQMQLLRRWRGVFRSTIANSRATARLLADEGIAPVTVIPYGLLEAPPRAEMASTPTAVFAGRLVKEKGVDTLLRAFAGVHARLPEASLDVVGEGVERPALEALADTLGLSHVVRFRGFQSQRQMEAIARTAWVQVVPSRWQEPFGLVAAEGMLRGTAVLASASGGLVDIVRDGVTGLLVPPDDVPAWVSALHRVLADRALAAQWGQAGYEVATVDYHHDVFVDRVLAEYAQAMV